MNERASLRLYLLGKPRSDSEIVLLAEYGGYRSVERFKLDAQRLQRLNSKIIDLRLYVESGSPAFDREGLIDLGDELFKVLFGEQTRRVFDRAAASSSKAHSRLPIELFVEDHAFAGWPWEYAFDKAVHSFLCEGDHPIVRGIFTIAHGRAPEPLQTKLRLLVLVGVRDDPKMNSGEELRHLQNVFGAGLANDAVEIHVIEGAALPNLDQFLQDNQFHILHFFGHARFDDAKQEGYLRFDVKDGQPFRLPARKFAAMVKNQNDLRLVFLNACESGRPSSEVDPARSAIAAALLDIGVPAVIATQFSIPGQSAPYLSSMIYNSLASGRPLVEAVTVGRRAMEYAEDSKFFDWGIPVLYASDPLLHVFPNPRQTPGLREFARRLESPKTVVSALGVSSGEAPSVKIASVALQTTEGLSSRLRVALVDLDINAGFLPDLVEVANKAQSFFAFEVAYLPLPAGSIQSTLEGEQIGPQLWIPRVEAVLKSTPSSLAVDRVCCLTENMLAVAEDGEIYYNYIAATLDSNGHVCVVSAADLREYASEAGIDYSKAVLRLCIGQLLAADPWGIDYHDETLGCLFDFCENRHDLVTALRKRRLDHAECRAKFEDAALLKAVDALLAL